MRLILRNIRMGTVHIIYKNKRKHLFWAVFICKG